MQEHPVPQNVTGYEFHLIGQMTLKQFMEVAAGIVVAVIIYYTNLPLIFKYPLIGIAGLTGIALAFIPLEGRPLDRWFFAFIKSIYQPTMFFWKKTNTTPDVFTYTPPKNMDTTPTIDFTPMRKSRLQEYVTTVAPTTTDTAPPDEEVQAAQAILQLFSEQSVVIPQTPVVTAPPTTEIPMGRITEMTIGTETTVTPVAPAPAQDNTPKEVVIVDSKTPISVGERKGVTPDLLAQNTVIAPSKDYGSLHSVDSHFKSENTDTVLPVVSIQGFPFPNKPTSPNMLAGMVVTTDDKIVEGAIITITRQADNTPVRAIKTNTLGQFAVVTPLESGTYIILTEKDGFVFDKYSLTLNNQVIEPILLRAHSSAAL